jgi:hypothetical protein
MVEKVFRKVHVRQRLDEGPLADIVRDYLGRLVGRGYSTFTIHQYVQSAEHFGSWLARLGVAVGSADATLVEEFLGRHLPRCRCRTPRNRTINSVRAALRQLLATVGVDWRRLDEGRSRGAIDAVVDDFERHLTHTCGAAPATRRYYLRETRTFLRTSAVTERAQGGPLKRVPLPALQAGSGEKKSPQMNADSR